LVTVGGRRKGLLLSFMRSRKAWYVGSRSISHCRELVKGIGDAFVELGTFPFGLVTI
jgi:hypothetical protein